MADTIMANPRVAVSTLNLHLRQKIEPIYRKRILLAGLRSHGRIKFNASGKAFDWRMRFRRRTLTPGDGDMQTIVFAALNTDRDASLPWRNYYLTEYTTKYERLVSEGPPETRFYRIVQRVADQLAGDAEESFADQLYVDGNAAGSTKRLHGFESWSSVSAALSNGYVGAPNDYYAGTYTNLGYYGGSWSPPASNNWPLGTGPVEYNFASPLVLDYTNTKWAGTTNTWVANWRKCLRFADTYLQTLQNVRPDIFLLSPELYRTAKDTLNDKETLDINQTSDLVKLGFKVVNWEGIDLAFEYGVPNNTGYGIVWDKLALHSLQGQLFEKDDDMDITTQTKRICIDFYGNLMIESPAFFVKFAAIS